MNPAESSLSAWRDAVQKALGDRPLASLTRKDGALSVAPLYTAADVAKVPDRGSVGVTPFVRGALRRARLGVVLDGAPDASRAIGEAAVIGAGAVLVSGLEKKTLADAVSHAGDATRPAIFARGVVPAGGGALLDAAAAHGFSLALGIDPLGLDSPGRMDEAIAPGGALRTRLAQAWDQQGDLPQIAIAPLGHHDAGAAAPTEIGVALAVFATCLREGLDDLGVAVLVASSDDVFETMAKLRALRVGLAKVRAALGAAPAPQTILGVVSRRRFVRYDVATNMLRGTTGAFGLAVGGADVVFGRPFDEALGASTAFSRRLAMTSLHVLAEEARVLDVHDAAGGAYYVESLAEQIGAHAWEEMRAIERAGGIRAAGSRVAERVAADAASRRAEVRKRKRTIVGLSEFALAHEVLPGGETRDDAEAARRVAASPHDGPLARDGADFERLRDAATAIAAARGTPPRVVCVTLGSARDHGPREAFTRRLFEVGGFEVTSVAAGGAIAAGTPATAGTASAPGVSAISTDDADLIVVAGSDRAYAEEGASAIAALRAGTKRPIWLAGNPGELREALVAAGLDDAFFAGADVVTILERAQDAARATGGAR